MTVTLEQAKVREIRRIAPGGIHELHLFSPVISSQVKPGQFVTLQPKAATSVMRRPFTVFMSDNREMIRIIFQAVGENTEAYACLKRGQRISVLGPLGQPVAIKANIELFLLIAGGCGLASLYYPAWLMKKETQARVMVGAGFRSQKHIFGLSDFTQLGAETDFVTQDEDGKTAVDLFREIISGEDSLPDRSKIQVFTCGPRLMMQGVAKLCQAEDISCFVFLEEIMACGGLGACKSDAVLTTTGVKCICQDGPIFPAEEVVWDESIKSR